MQTMDQILRAAKSGTSTPDFWLVASEKYEDVPFPRRQRQRQPRKVNLGTPPGTVAAEDFKPPFAGSTVDEAAAWRLRFGSGRAPLWRVGSTDGRARRGWQCRGLQDWRQEL
ncbi:Uu.00g057300.m01.CDS01 [Anthostomella pinea]|uniref:Uu.00g057300.m01.CDS01 n=1 Tax=Anthostomella pinea TaxID=933095 RepID=A0AAI8YMA1_9PEZI|nr:Uu.00g057300.m01.CDS01 [Anthostomella pinea]